MSVSILFLRFNAASFVFWFSSLPSLHLHLWQSCPVLWLQIASLCFQVSNVYFHIRALFQAQDSIFSFGYLMGTLSLIYPKRNLHSSFPNLFHLQPPLISTDENSIFPLCAEQKPWKRCCPLCFSHFSSKTPGNHIAFIFRICLPWNH